MTIEINKTIFRLYDIRGSSLSDVTPTLAYKIGFCFAQMQATGNRKICVGRDGRLSSPELYNGLVKGIIDAGGDVISVGIVPSPMLYFADKLFKPVASIMITASHNPKNDNGFKLLSQGRSFFNHQIQDLLNRILSTDWSHMQAKFLTIANVEEVNIVKQYIDRILQGITINPKLKIAWDPSNGSAGNITELLVSQLPNINIVINAKIDGNFPNHSPDPTIPENLEQLMKIVQSNDCDLGIAFDGDGDRLVVISKNGKIILGDQILCILAKDVIAQNPNATIIMDVKSSGAIFNQIKLYGGKPIMCKTGHSFIKDKMQETKALLAGETSGHIFFADKYYGYDDGIYAALRVIDLLSRTPKLLDNIVGELPKYHNSSEIKISVPDNVKFKIIDQIKEDLIAQNIIFDDIDGIRGNSIVTGKKFTLTTDSEWWLIRASNTEGKIIVKYESDSVQGLIRIRSDLASLLATYNLEL